MQAPLLRNKKVIAAASVAFLVGIGLAAAAQDGGFGGFDGLTSTFVGTGLDDGCLERGLPGSPLEMTVKDTGVHGDDRRASRTVTYLLDRGEARGLSGGIILLCSGVGDIEVHPEGSEVKLTFNIQASGDNAREKVENTEVEGLFTETRGGLGVAGQQLDVESRGDHGKHGHAGVDIELHIPDGGAYELWVLTGVGDIEVMDLTLEDVTAQTGVGDVDIQDVALMGAFAANTGVGDVDITVDRMDSIRIEADSGTGDIDIELPSARDVGHDVAAKTGVGSVDVDIGRDANYERTDDRFGPSEEVRARSNGYDFKDVRTVVHATTGVGNVDVWT